MTVVIFHKCQRGYLSGVNYQIGKHALVFNSGAQMGGKLNY